MTSPRSERCHIRGQIQAQALTPLVLGSTAGNGMKKELEDEGQTTQSELDFMLQSPLNLVTHAEEAPAYSLTEGRHTMHCHTYTVSPST